MPHVSMLQSLECSKRLMGIPMIITLNIAVFDLTFGDNPMKHQSQLSIVSVIDKQKLYDMAAEINSRV
jgi:hypothetical protein